MALSTFFTGLTIENKTKSDKILRWLMLIHGIFFIVCLIMPMTGILQQTADSNSSKAGVNKKSFMLPYNGGEIWFEHLDGMYQYSDIVYEKLMKDSEMFLQLSKSSFIAIVLFETNVNDKIVEALVSLLTESKKEFRKVCFVGATQWAKRKIISKIDINVPFQMCFMNDTEKAKEWLLP